MLSKRCSCGSWPKVRDRVSSMSVLTRLISLCKKKCKVRWGWWVGWVRRYLLMRICHRLTERARQPCSLDRWHPQAKIWSKWQLTKAWKSYRMAKCLSKKRSTAASFNKWSLQTVKKEQLGVNSKDQTANPTNLTKRWVSTKSNKINLTE